MTLTTDGILEHLPKNLRTGFLRILKERKEFEEENLKLQAELGQFKKVLVICANCFRMPKKQMERDPAEKRGWLAPADFLHQKLGMEFSHAICPDCMEELYPEFYPPGKK